MARPSLQNNVKFKALVRRLQLPRPYVRGLLDTMWDVANESGNPTLGNGEDVESAAEWPGTPGTFFSACKDIHFVDELPDGRWVIHDYWDHAPKYVKNRAYMESRRKGSYRPKNDWKLDRSTSKDLQSDCGPHSANVAQCYLPPAPAPLSPYGDASAIADPTNNAADPATQTTAPAVVGAGKVQPEKAKGRREKSPPKPEVGEVRTYFRERWKGRNATDYAWKYGRDDAHAKWLLDQVGNTPAKAKQIIDAFMADEDPWLADRGHEISLLVSRFNRYRSKPPAEAEGNGFVRAEMTAEEADEIVRSAAQ